MAARKKGAASSAAPDNSTSITLNMTAALANSVLFQATSEGDTQVTWIVQAAQEAMDAPATTRVEAFTAVDDSIGTGRDSHKQLTWPADVTRAVVETMESDWIEHGYIVSRARWVVLAIGARLRGGLAQVTPARVTAPLTKRLRQIVTAHPEAFDVTLSSVAAVPSKPLRVPRTIRLNPTTLAHALREADREGMSLEDWLEHLIARTGKGPDKEAEKDGADHFVRLAAGRQRGRLAAAKRALKNARTDKDRAEAQARIDAATAALEVIIPTAAELGVDLDAPVES